MHIILLIEHGTKFMDLMQRAYLVAASSSLTSIFPPSVGKSAPLSATAWPAAVLCMALDVAGSRRSRGSSFSSEAHCTGGILQGQSRLWIIL